MHIIPASCPLFVVRFFGWIALPLYGVSRNHMHIYLCRYSKSPIKSNYLLFTAPL